LIADSVLDGLAAGQVSLGVDLGASEAPLEPTLQRELTPAPQAVEQTEAALEAVKDEPAAS
uniref:hypothetical protein n=1 Tax=Acinetobacter nosocomialis TaxID=106654 RepID=UPI001C0978E1